MRIDVVPYTREHEEGVRQFNARLGDFPFEFPASSESEWLPRQKSDRVYEELSLAVDEALQVRGAYILKHQEFVLSGRVRSIADYYRPISEAVIDPAYNPVGLKLLGDAARKQPRLFALGMGSTEEPLPRMLAALGWRIVPVPFFFRVVHAGAFLRNVAALRSTRLRRVAFDLAAASGLGGLGVRLSRLVRPGRRVPRSVTCEQVGEFSRWADDVWQACKDQYALVAVRDRDVLNALYPAEQSRFVRLRVARAGRPIGWAVLLVTQMCGHKHFGDMTVGTLVDCLAEPGDAADVAAAARDVLARRGADVMVSNQAHGAWCAALRASGFLGGPSNFLFAASPELAAELQPFDEKRCSFHLNRGDGEGPVHL